MNGRKYAQLVAPLLGTLAMVVVLAYRGASEDNVITGPEWVLGITQVLMVISVWGAANVPGWTKGKTVQAAVFAALALLAGFATDGRVTGDEALQLVITVLSALGVVATPPVLFWQGRTGKSPLGTPPSGPAY